MDNLPFTYDEYKRYHYTFKRDIKYLMQDLKSSKAKCMQYIDPMFYVLLAGIMYELLLSTNASKYSIKVKDSRGYDTYDLDKVTFFNDLFSLTKYQNLIALYLSNEQKAYYENYISNTLRVRSLGYIYHAYSKIVEYYANLREQKK